MKMKALKVCSIAALSLFTTNSFAQSWQANISDLETDGSTNNVFIHNNLGIGTTNILNRLNINGDIGFDANSGWYRHIFTRSVDHGLAIYSGSVGWQDGAGILLNGDNNTGNNPGAIDFTCTDPVSSNTESAFTFWGTDASGGWTDRYLTIDKRGHVGIGALPSSEVLNINGSIDFTANPGLHQAVRGHSNSHGIVLWANSTWQDGSGILLNGSGGTEGGDIAFVAPELNPGSGQTAFSYWTADNTGAWTKRLMYMDKDGQVVIGDNIWSVGTNNYKLYVQTGILTEKLKVATVYGGNWSDYVFADDYSLRSLNDVENYINKNKHLPDVPSADDVVKNGYDVTQMDATLLQKIEELTLYVIEQQKQIDDLKSKLNK